MNRFSFFFFFFIPSFSFACSICDPLSFVVSSERLKLSASNNPALLSSIESALSSLPSSYNVSSLSGAYVTNVIVDELNSQIASGSISIDNPTDELISGIYALRNAHIAGLVYVISSYASIYLGSYAPVLGLFFVDSSSVPFVLNPDSINKESFYESSFFSSKLKGDPNTWISLYSISSSDSSRRPSQYLADLGQLSGSGGITYGFWPFYNYRYWHAQYMSDSGSDPFQLCFNHTGVDLIVSESRCVSSDGDTVGAVLGIDYSSSNCPDGTRFFHFLENEDYETVSYDYLCQSDYDTDDSYPFYFMLTSGAHSKRPIFETYSDNTFHPFPGRPSIPDFILASSSIIQVERLDSGSSASILLKVESLGGGNFAISYLVSNVSFIDSGKSFTANFKFVRIYNSSGQYLDSQFSYSTSTGFEINPNSAAISDTVLLTPPSGSNVIDQYNFYNVPLLYSVDVSQVSNSQQQVLNVDFSHDLPPGSIIQPDFIDAKSILDDSELDDLTGDDIFQVSSFCPSVYFDFRELGVLGRSITNSSYGFLDVDSMENKGNIPVDIHCTIFGEISLFLRAFFIFGFALSALWIVLES